MTTSPIALFTYNRPEHTRQTVEALVHNELASESPLIVFSDGPKAPEDAPKVKAVREFIGHVSGFKSIDLVCRPANDGLARSIINGVTEVCRSHGTVIVLEDDIITSPFFLRYMNQALSLYENTPEVICIHGYIYPVREPLPESFFIRGADCQAWATWKRGWDLFEPNGARLLSELESRGLTREFDFNGAYDYCDMLRSQIAGRVDSWAIRWFASAFLREKLTLYPGRSLVDNIGWDGSGAHCDVTDLYKVSITKTPIVLARLEPVENKQARIAFARFLQRIPKQRSVWGRLKSLIRKSIPSRLLRAR